MRQKSQKKQYNLTVEFANGLTKSVKVKAADRETAERRALKFNPGAVRVKP